MIAAFSSPSDVDVDSAGNVFVSDSGNQRLRVVSPDGTTRTLSGNGVASYQDSQLPTNVSFNAPMGIALDEASQALYVSDSANNRIRLVNVSTGATTTAATGALLLPQGVVVDRDSGSIIVADTGNNRICQV